MSTRRRPVRDFLEDLLDGDDAPAPASPKPVAPTPNPAPTASTEETPRPVPRPKPPVKRAAVEEADIDQGPLRVAGLDDQIANDFDNDGIVDEIDQDADGDGLTRIEDRDEDNDGILDVVDEDIDGDGFDDGSEGRVRRLTGEAVIPLADGTEILAREAPGEGDEDGFDLTSIFNTSLEEFGAAVKSAAVAVGEAVGIQQDANRSRIRGADEVSEAGLGDGEAAVFSDLDRDGVLDAIDSDIDNDFLVNDVDPDDDNDETPDSQDFDVDGDGFIDNTEEEAFKADSATVKLETNPGDNEILPGLPSVPNATNGVLAGESDFDGDDIPDRVDPDIDEDTLLNADDPDDDNDGRLDASASEIDVDGDGFLDREEPAAAAKFEERFGTVEEAEAAGEDQVASFQESVQEFASDAFEFASDAFETITGGIFTDDEVPVE